MSRSIIVVFALCCACTKPEAAPEKPKVAVQKKLPKKSAQTQVKTKPLGGDDRVHRARAALAKVKAPLRKALTGALSTSTPSGALDACAGIAPGLTAKPIDNVRVGRASEKLRNKANAGPKWTQKILEELRDSRPASVGYRTVELDGGGLGYAEPIYAEKMCLTCHGDPSDDVKKALKARFPDDRATGYKLGDFRGVFWAEVPAS